MVVGGASPACHPHEHQQRRSVGFGLIEKPIWVGKKKLYWWRNVPAPAQARWETLLLRAFYQLNDIKP